MVYLRFWREIIMAILALLFALGGWYHSALMSVVKNNLTTAQSERDQYKAALDFQNFTLLQEAEDHARKLAEFPKEITKIHTKYEVIYTGIDQWKGDTNASDCQNADKFLRSFNY